MNKVKRAERAPVQFGGAMTMADLAKLAGVSKITVSRALSETGVVNPATRARIRELASEHGYKLNVSARNLRLRQSLTVAVVVEMMPSAERPMSGPYPLELLGGISQELAAANYSVLLTTRQNAKAPAVQAADALILLGQGAHQQAVHQFDKYLRMPMVVWGAPVAGDTHVLVGSDNHKGGAIAAERFLALGRRHPVFLGDTDHAEMTQRLRGFRERFKEHGVVPVVVDHKPFTTELGYESVHSLWRKKTRFDAIFACNDLLAIGAIRALIELGQRVPDDVSVIGYDDTPLGSTFLPPLTSVHQDWHEGGVLLARKALALFRGETVKSETLSCHLVVRAT